MARLISMKASRIFRAIYRRDNILEWRGQRAGGKRVPFDPVGSVFAIWGEILTFIPRAASLAFCPIINVMLSSA